MLKPREQERSLAVTFCLRDMSGGFVKCADAAASLEGSCHTSRQYLFFRTAT